MVNADVEKKSISDVPARGECPLDPWTPGYFTYLNLVVMADVLAPIG